MEAGELSPAPAEIFPDEQARHQATLTDHSGRRYRQHAVHETAHQVKGRSVFPTAVADQVLLFDVPPPELHYLRLELPAAFWGGTGFFRFTIPSAMVRRDI
jgi:hypothetical protein